MSRTYRIIFILLGTCLIAACSRKKDNFVNRSWHSVGTKYNILYNGNLALEAGLEEVRQSYRDDFWDVLPIERMTINEDITLPGQQKNANFERAEEKATKAYQKHSMLNNGEEYNPQMDEAFILLGKARYYDQRFIPALEAFNYILFKYPKGNQINEAKIWREKVNIRLDNPEVALDNLRDLLATAKLEKQQRADAYAALSQAFYDTEQLDSSVHYLNKASRLTKIKDDQGRFTYVSGQLFQRTNQKDSAIAAYDRVIEMHRAIPRVYYISAHLGKIMLTEPTGQQDIALEEYMESLASNRENRPYLDRIYYAQAEYFNQLDSTQLAIDYYNKSLRANREDRKLYAFDYSALGDLYFDEARFPEAGAYYDSTLTNLDQRTRPYRDFSRKRKSLDDVILYEDRAKTLDSVLTLVSMSGDERKVFFDDYIRDLRKQEEETASSGAQSLGSTTVSTGLGNVPSTPNATTGVFYFYNPQTAAYGLQEFERRWGNRKLQDNWRLSSLQAGTDIVEGQPIGQGQGADAGIIEDRYNPDFYISQVPGDQKVIDSLIKERDRSYYQLGLLYKDKFDRSDLSAPKLEQFLSNNPEERFILPAKYNLYKAYERLEDTENMNRLGNDITTNYPDSRYAAIINNPTSLRDGAVAESEKKYTELYRLMEDQEYQRVIIGTTALINELVGEEIVPQFELLRARARGRLEGFDVYRSELLRISTDYPNSPEGKQAKTLGDSLNRLANTQFQKDSENTTYKLVYTGSKTKAEAKALEKRVRDALNASNKAFFETSIDAYTGDEWYVVLHGLDTQLGAQGLSDILAEKASSLNQDRYPISAANYTIVMVHKLADQYRTDFITQ